ncbi:MAG: hypothetical protein R3D63_12150 [Paracoccaceae bacterium]
MFGPAVAEFASYEPHYGASLVAQGSGWRRLPRATWRCRSPRRRS